MAATQPSIQLSPHSLRSLTIRNLRLLKAATTLQLGLDSAITYPACKVSLKSDDRLLVRDLYGSLERDYIINGRKNLINLTGYWKNHLERRFGDLPAASLTIKHINAYIAERQIARAANATINRELAILRRCFMLAINTGVLKHGERPYVPRLKERNVRKGFVQDEQYRRLAQATGEIGLWLRAMFEVGYTYGWRKNELLTRRVQHANFLGRTLNLDPGETKNGEARTVHMTSKVFELLKECAVGKNPEDYLFTRLCDHIGREVKSPRVVEFRDDWAAACVAAGLGKMVCRECRKTGELVTVTGKHCAKCGKKFGARSSKTNPAYMGLLFHDLRRSGVSNMIRDGVSEKQAMTQSGHLTRAVFDRYHIVDPAQGLEIARKMEKGASLRGISAGLVQGEPSQLQLPFGDNPPRKPVESDVRAPRERKVRGR